MRNVCAITGHRPEGFSWNYYNKQCSQHQNYLYQVKNTAIKLIEKENCTTFITGGARGVDLDFALTILKLKETYSNIKLTVALPYMGHHNSMTEEEKGNYQLVLQKADSIKYITKHYTRLCFLVRNKYMVDNATMLLAYYNGVKQGGTYQTINYATKQNIPVYIIAL